MGFSRQEYWSGVPSPSPSLSLQVVTIKLCSEDLTMYFYRAFLKVQLLGGSDFVIFRKVKLQVKRFVVFLRGNQ